MNLLRKSCEMTRNSSNAHRRRLTRKRTRLRFTITSLMLALAISRDHGTKLQEENIEFGIKPVLIQLSSQHWVSAPAFVTHVWFRRHQQQHISLTVAEERSCHKLILLLLSGIEPNPGPFSGSTNKTKRNSQYLCSTCHQECRWGQDALACDSCDHWVHRVCSGYSVQDYHDLGRSHVPWICTKCKKEEREALLNFSRDRLRTEDTSVGMSRNTHLGQDKSFTHEQCPGDEQSPVRCGISSPNALSSDESIDLNQHQSLLDSSLCSSKQAGWPSPQRSLMDSPACGDASTPSTPSTPSGQDEKLNDNAGQQKDAESSVDNLRNTNRTSESALKHKKKLKCTKGKQSHAEDGVQNTEAKNKQKNQSKPATDSHSTPNGDGSVWAKLGAFKCRKCGFTTTDEALYNCHVCTLRKLVPATCTSVPVTSSPTGCSRGVVQRGDKSSPVVSSVTASSDPGPVVERTLKPHSSSAALTHVAQRVFESVAGSRPSSAAGSPQPCSAVSESRQKAQQRRQPQQSRQRKQQSRQQPQQSRQQLQQSRQPQQSRQQPQQSQLQPQHHRGAVTVLAPSSCHPVVLPSASSAHTRVSGPSSAPLPVYQLVPVQLVAVPISSSSGVIAPCASEPQSAERSVSQSSSSSPRPAPSGPGSKEMQKPVRRQGHILYKEATEQFFCMQCTYKASEGDSLTEHLIFQMVTSPYHCPYCDSGFPDRATFQSHCLMEHKDLKMKCKLKRVSLVKKVLSEAREKAKLGHMASFDCHSDFKTCLKHRPLDLKHATVVSESSAVVGVVLQASATKTAPTDCETSEPLTVGSSVEQAPEQNSETTSSLESVPAAHGHDPGPAASGSNCAVTDSSPQNSADARDQSEAKCLHQEDAATMHMNTTVASDAAPQRDDHSSGLADHKTESTRDVDESTPTTAADLLCRLPDVDTDWTSSSAAANGQSEATCLSQYDSATAYVNTSVASDSISQQKNLGQAESEVQSKRDVSENTTTTETSDLVCQLPTGDTGEPEIQIVSCHGNYHGHQENSGEENLSSDHVEKEVSAATDMTHLALSAEIPNLSTVDALPQSSSEALHVSSVVEDSVSDQTDPSLAVDHVPLTGQVGIYSQLHSVCDVRNPAVSVEPGPVSTAVFSSPAASTHTDTGSARPCVTVTGSNFMDSGHAYDQVQLDGSTINNLSTSGNRNQQLRSGHLWTPEQRTAEQNHFQYQSLQGSAPNNLHVDDMVHQRYGAASEQTVQLTYLQVSSHSSIRALRQSVYSQLGLSRQQRTLQNQYRSFGNNQVSTSSSNYAEPQYFQQPSLAQWPQQNPSYSVQQPVFNQQHMRIGQENVGLHTSQAGLTVSDSYFSAQSNNTAFDSSFQNSMFQAQSYHSLQYNGAQATVSAQQYRDSQGSSSHSSAHLPVCQAQQRGGRETQNRAVISQHLLSPELRSRLSTLPSNCTISSTSSASIYAPITPPSSPSPSQRVRSYSPITPPYSTGLNHTSSRVLASYLSEPPQIHLTQRSGCGDISAPPSSELSSNTSTVAASVVLGSSTVSVSSVDNGTASLPGLSTVHRIKQENDVPFSSSVTETPHASPSLSSQQSFNWPRYFVKYHNTYVCLLCRKRMQDKDEFAVHVWAHMHPEEKRCNSCCDVSRKLCTKAVDTIKSVTSYLDRSVLSQLKNDSREKFTRLLGTSETDIHRFSRDVPGGSSADEILPSSQSVPAQPECRVDDLETSSTEIPQNPSHESTLTDAAAMHANSNTLNVDSSVASNQEQEQDRVCTEVSNNPDQAWQDAHEEICESTGQPACSEAFTCSEAVSKDQQEPLNAAGHDITLSTREDGGEMNDENERAVALAEPGDHDSVKAVEEGAQEPLLRSLDRITTTREHLSQRGPPEFDRSGAFFICTLCKFSCDTAVDFTMHLNSDHHDDEVFPCFHCNYRGLYTTDLTNHLNAHTMGESNMYMCPYSSERCKFKTDSFRNLCEHIKLHQDISSFVCHKCESSFDSDVDFQTHVRSSSITLYTCSRCPARFLDKRAIQQHWRAEHSGGQVYRVTKVLLCLERKINGYLHTGNETPVHRQSLDESFSAGDSPRPNQENGNDQVPDSGDTGGTASGAFCTDAQHPALETVQISECSNINKIPHCSGELVPAPETWHAGSQDPPSMFDHEESLLTGGVSVSKGETHLSEDTDLDHALLSGSPGLETEVSDQHACEEVCRSDLVSQSDEMKSDLKTGLPEDVPVSGNSPQPTQLHCKSVDEHEVVCSANNLSERASCSSPESVHDPLSSTNVMKGDSKTTGHDFLPHETDLSSVYTAEEVAAVAIDNVKLIDLFGSSELHQELLGFLYSEEKSQFRCGICDREFDKLDRIHRHLFVHFSVPLFSCPLCQFSCYLRADFKTHFMRDHPEEKKFCNYLLVNRSQFLKQLHHLTTIQDFEQMCRSLTQENKQSSQTTSGALATVLPDHPGQESSVDIPCVTDDASETDDACVAEEAGDLQVGEAHSSLPQGTANDDTSVPGQEKDSMDVGEDTEVCVLDDSDVVETTLDTGLVIELDDCNVQETAVSTVPVTTGDVPVAAGEVITVIEEDDVQETAVSTVPVTAGDVPVAAGEVITVIEEDDVQETAVSTVPVTAGDVPVAAGEVITVIEDDIVQETAVSTVPVTTGDVPVAAGEVITVIEDDDVQETAVSTVPVTAGEVPVAAGEVITVIEDDDVQETAVSTVPVTAGEVPVAAGEVITVIEDDIVQETAVSTVPVTAGDVPVAAGEVITVTEDDDVQETAGDRTAITADSAKMAVEVIQDHDSEGNLIPVSAELCVRTSIEATVSAGEGSVVPAEDASLAAGVTSRAPEDSNTETAGGTVGDSVKQTTEDVSVLTAVGEDPLPAKDEKTVSTTEISTGSQELCDTISEDAIVPEANDDLPSQITARNVYSSADAREPELQRSSPDAKYCGVKSSTRHMQNRRKGMGPRLSTESDEDLDWNSYNSSPRIDETCNSPTSALGFADSDDYSYRTVGTSSHYPSLQPKWSSLEKQKTSKESPARPKKGTYCSVRTGSMTRLKCNACGCTTLSLSAMALHQKTCAYHQNTQPISKHTDVASSLAKKMRIYNSDDAGKQTFSSQQLKRSRRSQLMSSRGGSKCLKDCKKYHSVKNSNTEKHQEKTLEEAGDVSTGNVQDSEVSATDKKLVGLQANRLTSVENSLTELSPGSVRTNPSSKSLQEHASSADSDHVNNSFADRRLESSLSDDEVILRSKKVRVRQIVDSSSDEAANFGEDSDHDAHSHDTEKEDTDVESEQIVQCKHCDFTTPSSDEASLQFHIENSHYQFLGLLKCEYCGFSYGKAARLIKHIRSCHPGSPEKLVKVPFIDYYKEMKEKENCSPRNSGRGLNSNSTQKFKHVKEQDAEHGEPGTSRVKKFKSAKQKEAERSGGSSNGSSEKFKGIKRREAEHSVLGDHSKTKKFKNGEQVETEHVRLNGNSSTRKVDSRKRKAAECSGSDDQSSCVKLKSSSQRETDHARSNGSCSSNQFKSSKQTEAADVGPKGGKSLKLKKSKQQDQSQPTGKSSTSRPHTSLPMEASSKAPSKVSVQGHAEKECTDAEGSITEPHSTIQQQGTEQSMAEDERSQASTRKKQTGRYSCVVCSQRMPDEQSMKAHLTRHLEFCTPLCGTCFMEFMTVEEAQSHHDKQHHGQPFKSPVYKPDTERKLKHLLTDSLVEEEEEEDDSTAVLHKENAVAKPESTKPVSYSKCGQSIKCQQCKVVLDSLMELRSHCEDKHGGKSDCEWTDLKSQGVYDLSGVLVRKRTGFNRMAHKYLCAFCSRRFEHRELAAKHQRRKHSDVDETWILRLRFRQKSAVCPKHTSSSVSGTVHGSRSSAGPSSILAGVSSERGASRKLLRDNSGSDKRRSMDCVAMPAEDDPKLTGSVSIVLRDILSPDFGQEFGKLLVSNGITKLQMSSRSSISNKAYRFLSMYAKH